MTVRSFIRRIIAGSAFTLLSLGVAQAGGIFTPILFLGGNDQLICIANNVSGAPLTVRVRIIGVLPANSAQQTCTLPVGDKNGCQAFLAGSGHCRIFVDALTTEQVQLRVRGVMFSRITTAPFTVDAVVQAQ